MAADISGNIYLADSDTCAIRFINKQTGIITTIVGGTNGMCGSSGDNFAAMSATLNSPSGLSLDSTNNLLYIADTNNHKIRLVTFSTGIITTYAGTGINGYNGDRSLATITQLNYPLDVACDSGGNVYIADSLNNRVRKVNSNGIISTFAGGGSYSPGDGLKATLAVISSPTGLAADRFGNVFIVDSTNAKIRMVNGTGFITTFAGGGGCFGCDGHAAVDVMFDSLVKVTVGVNGNVYFTDNMNNVIYLVAHGTGIVTTFAGVVGGGGSESLGDGGPASSAHLYGPQALTVDVSGTLYFGDTFNHRVRKIVSTTNYPTSQPSSQPSKPSGQPTEQPTSEPSKYVWYPKQSVSTSFFPPISFILCSSNDSSVFFYLISTLPFSFLFRPLPALECLETVVIMVWPSMLK